MDGSKQCLKCAGTMVDGFVVDKGDYGSTSVPSWREGEPRKSFWMGGLKLSETTPLEVTTFRCRRCGYLESYALEE